MFKTQSSITPVDSNQSLRILSQKGFGIIEVMVAAGLMLIIAVGMIAMVTNMQEEQRKSVLLRTLVELKARMETNIRLQPAFSNAINDATNNASLACVAGNTTCTATATPSKIILKDASGGIAFNLLDWSSTGTNGFTEGGASCTSFSATTGTDLCPISYRLVYILSCPAAAATCVNPLMKITGRLIFNPSASGFLNKLRGLIAVGSLTSASATTDDGKYDVAVTRSASTVNRYFKIAMQKSGGGASSCATSGAGTCSTASTSPLTLHPGTWTEVDDNNVTATLTSGLVTINGGNQSFTINETGLYGCDIRVTAFATGGFTSQLYNNTTAQILGTGYTTAGLWASSQAQINTKFNVSNVAHAFSLRQRCDSVPTASAPGDTSVGVCSLGFQITTYGATPTDVVTATCYKLERGD